MNVFLLPLCIGILFNWSSAFTGFFSRRMGKRAGSILSFVTRNVLGIPVWVTGLFLAFRENSWELFPSGWVTTILAWAFLLIGTIPMVWGLWWLRLRSFRPTQDDHLVDDGIFRYVRHPVYTGLLIDLPGLFLSRPTAPVVIACALLAGFVFVQARLEEVDLVQRIPAYRQYMNRVPRFFPRLGSPQGETGGPAGV